MGHWHGGFTGSIREEDVLGKAYDARLMKRLLRYARPFIHYVVAAVILMCLATACRLAVPYLIKVAYGEIFRKSAGTADTAPFLRRLDMIVVIGAGILALAFFLRIALIIVTNLLGQKIMHRLRTEIFDHLQSLSLSFFDNNPAGRLVTRVTSDVLALNELFTAGIIDLIFDFLMIFGILIVLSLHSVKMTLVALTLTPPLFVGAYLFRIKAREVFRNVRMKIARVNAFVAETVSGIRIIQIFTQEDRSARRFTEVNDDYRNENLRVVKYTSIYSTFVQIMSRLSRVFVIWFAAYFIAGGSLEHPEFILFWFYIGMLFRPIIDLSGKYSILQSAMAASERIFKLLDTKPEVENPQVPLTLPALRGRIEFRDVWFSYDADAGSTRRQDKGSTGLGKKNASPEAKPHPANPGSGPGEPNYVLKNIELCVTPGESIALVGATGAGKTSIVSLLTRLYDVKRGRILVDGIDIRTVDKHAVRSQIGTVMQDVFLFSGDIRRNITLGDKSISDDALQDACDLVNAQGFISRMPAGYDSPVAERGATFSAGERQLLSFARAIVRKPPIIVLDEATSSVDTETEQLIQNGLARLMQGRTCIIVAHRLSTIKRVDRIIVLHHGEIVEEGSHQQLLSRPGIYRKLYELQYKSQEPRAAATGGSS